MTPRKGAVPARLKSSLVERASGACEVCGSRSANNAHHRKNLSQGGTHELSNLLLLCGSGTTLCHGWITEHPGAAKREYGWSVWRSDEPADVPVLYRGQWVKLDNDGNVHVLKKGSVRNVLGHLSIHD
jgi:hypothetical protein